MSSDRISFRLRAIVASVFFLLFAVFLLTVTYLYQNSQSQAAHFSLLADLSRLESESNNLRSRGEYYVKNAPRDYETYFRDVAVYHREMQEDILRIDGLFNTVELNYRSDQNNLSESLNRLFYSSAWTVLGAQISESGLQWKNFRSGLAKALGDDATEPRLEWGAEFIVENSGRLSSDLSLMINGYRQILDNISKKSKELALLAILLSGLVMILGLLLMQKIVLRVGATAKACERVANGDFGFQVPDSGDDEIGHMTRAFNSLSSRVRLVLGLLTKLNKTREPGEALEAFWADAKAYFDLEWLGLMIQTTDGERLVLTHQKSHQRIKGWQNRHIDLLTGAEIERSLASKLEAKEAYLAERVNQNPTEYSNSHFFREFIQKVMPSSFVVLPLVNHNRSWKAVLILAKGYHDAFDQEQMQLLKNLAPVIGSIFANATSNKKVKSLN